MMKATFKTFLYLVLLLLPAAGFTTQKVSTVAPVEVRRPTNARIEKFQKDGDFQYETDYTEKIGLWDAFWHWMKKHIFSPLIRGHELTIWNIIEYGLAIATIIFVAYYFIKSDRIGLFSRGPKKLQLDIEGGEEDINKMNFDKLVSDAIENRQYRIAIRYLYLKLLKDLSDNQLINWRAEKTNRDYINELRPTDYGKQFREVTLLFDYAWYGDVTINENSFGQIRDSFKEFNSKLSNLA